MQLLRSCFIGFLTFGLILSCKNVESQETTHASTQLADKKEIGSGEYQQMINSYPVVLIDFSATWCGPCKKLSPLLEKISQQREKDFKLYTIDVDENPGIAQQNEVEMLPTLIWYKNGKLVKRVFGLQTEKAINLMIDELVK